MDNDSLNNLIDIRLKQQLQGNLFTARKLGDTPTDNLSLTPRGYVNLNGTVELDNTNIDPFGDSRPDKSKSTLMYNAIRPTATSEVSNLIFQWEASTLRNQLYPLGQRFNIHNCYFTFGNSLT